MIVVSPMNHLFKAYVEIFGSEDEQFDQDKAQVLKEISELDPKGKGLADG